MTSELKKAFSEELREVRTTLGMTQSDLGNQIGISDRYVSQIEKGKPIPVRTVEKLRTQLQKLKAKQEPVGLVQSRLRFVSVPALKAADKIVDEMARSADGARYVSTRSYSAALRFRRTVDPEAFLSLAEFAYAHSKPGRPIPLSCVDMSINDFQSGMTILKNLALEMQRLSEDTSSQTGPTLQVVQSEFVSFEVLKEFLSLDLEWHLTVLKLAGLKDAEQSYVGAFETINSMDGGERLRSRKMLERISVLHLKATDILMSGDAERSLAILDEHDQLFLSFKHHLASVIHAAISASNERLRDHRIAVNDCSIYFPQVANGFYWWTGPTEELPFLHDSPQTRAGNVGGSTSTHLSYTEHFSEPIALALRQRTNIAFLATGTLSNLERIKADFSKLVEAVRNHLNQNCADTTPIHQLLLMVIPPTNAIQRAEQLFVSGATRFLFNVTSANADRTKIPVASKPDSTLVGRNGLSTAGESRIRVILSALDAIASPTRECEGMTRCITALDFTETTSTADSTPSCCRRVYEEFKRLLGAYGMSFEQNSTDQASL